MSIPAVKLRNCRFSVKAASRHLKVYCSFILQLLHDLQENLRSVLQYNVSKEISFAWIPFCHSTSIFSCQVHGPLWQLKFSVIQLHIQVYSGWGNAVRSSMKLMCVIAIRTAVPNQCKNRIPTNIFLLSRYSQNASHLHHSASSCTVAPR